MAVSEAMQISVRNEIFVDEKKTKVFYQRALIEATCFLAV
jgi:hypothetical protein